MVSPTTHYDDELLEVHLATAAAALPGPDYYTALQWIHDELRPPTYLEVGVRSGESLRKARRETKCIGIDPVPAIQEPLTPNISLFPLTSDEFFAKHRLDHIWGTPNFSLAFIDGEHLFEQALRDFIHLERLSTPNSLVMIHDCLPLDAITSARARETHFYSGDVWKVALCLKVHRPDLRIKTVLCSPSGLCLVTGLNSSDRKLRDNYEDLVQQYVPLSYEDYLQHKAAMPDTIANDQAAVRSSLCEML